LGRTQGGRLAGRETAGEKQITRAYLKMRRKFSVEEVGEEAMEGWDEKTQFSLFGLWGKGGTGRHID